MTKRSGIFTFGKKKARGESYVATLIQTLESIDFAQAQKAVEALGEAADPAAIKTLVSLIKGSAALRAAATVSLKKIGQEDDAATTELAIALMKAKETDAAKDIDIRSLSPADRRRTPRVLLEIPVVVKWQDKSGKTYAEPSTTKIVNAYGALLVLKQPVALGTELEITNLSTQAAVKARVTWIGSSPSEGGQEVGVELGTADPDFWGKMTFPPSRSA